MALIGGVVFPRVGDECAGHNVPTPCAPAAACMVLEGRVKSGGKMISTCRCKLRWGRSEEVYHSARKLYHAHTQRVRFLK